MSSSIHEEAMKTEVEKPCDAFSALHIETVSQYASPLSEGFEVAVINGAAFENKGGGAGSRKASAFFIQPAGTP